jgi:hypothetical protein
LLLLLLPLLLLLLPVLLLLPCRVLHRLLQPLGRNQQPAPLLLLGVLPLLLLPSLLLLLLVVLVVMLCWQLH